MADQTSEYVPNVSAEDVRVLLSRALQQRSAVGYFPFEGQWLTRDQIAKHLRRQRRRTWVVAGELMVLYAFLAAAAGGMLILTYLLAY